MSSLKAAIRLRRALKRARVVERPKETVSVLHADVDKHGFPRRLLSRIVPHNEPFVVVEVVNTTPEPGHKALTGCFWNAKTRRSHKLYHLTVHFELRPLPTTGKWLGESQALTCHNAVASTFGLRGEEYDPDVES